MNDLQEKVLNVLADMPGEQVAQLFIDIYGTQVLDDASLIHELELQGYSIEDEEDEDDED